MESLGACPMVASVTTRTLFPSSAKPTDRTAVFVTIDDTSLPVDTSHSLAELSAAPVRSKVEDSNEKLAL
jgi:hypothetical protein